MEARVAAWNFAFLIGVSQQAEIWFDPDKYT